MHVGPISRKLRPLTGSNFGKSLQKWPRIDKLWGKLTQKIEKFAKYYKKFFCWKKIHVGPLKNSEIRPKLCARGSSKPTPTVFYKFFLACPFIRILHHFSGLSIYAYFTRFFWHVHLCEFCGTFSCMFIYAYFTEFFLPC